MTSVSILAHRLSRKARGRYSAPIRTTAFLLCLSAAVSAVEQSDARWLLIKRELIGDRVVQDGAQVVGLETPVRALDSAVVPVEMTAKMVQTPERYISKLYLVIDNNPSPVAAVFDFPGKRAWESISTRIRVNSYTNVRALAELNDGDLYMSSNFVKASGGCSAPAMKDPAAAAAHMGRMKLVLPRENAGNMLLAKLLIKHPNSSGMQLDQISRNYIPADYVRSIEVDFDGEPLFKAATDISISEDPAISFGFERLGDGRLDVRVTDSQGRHFNEDFQVSGAGKVSQAD